MYNSLRGKTNLSENTVIMPGHNYSIKRQSTMKEEIQGNFFSFNNLKILHNIECMIMTNQDQSRIHLLIWRR